MISRNRVRFDGKRACPDRILLGMQGDNLSEQVIFVLPKIDYDQAVYVKWTGSTQNSDIILCKKGSADGEWLWNVSETDTRVAQEMDVYIQIMAGESVVWSSEIFTCAVGRIPDVDSEVEQKYPSVIQGILDEMAAHEITMNERVAQIEQTASKATKKVAEDLAAHETTMNAKVAQVEEAADAAHSKIAQDVAAADAAISQKVTQVETTAAQARKQIADDLTAHETTMNAKVVELEGDVTAAQQKITQDVAAVRQEMAAQKTSIETTAAQARKKIADDLAAHETTMNAKVAQVEGLANTAQTAANAAKEAFAGMLDTDTGKIKMTYIPGMLIHRWGVEIPATSAAACTRLYDAEGMAANAHKGSYNAALKNDFDEVFLMKARAERINYDIANQRILAREGDSTFALDGSNGDVFVRQVAHWRKREVLEDGREIRAFADGALEGYEYVPERLIPCFLASAADSASESNNATGTMRSVCGDFTIPLTSVSLQNFLAKAKNTGCTLMDMDTWADQADMMLIEYANRNVQNMIGNGIVSNYYNNTTFPLLAETDANRVVLEKARAANIIPGWNTICIGTTQYSTNKAAYRLVTAVKALNDTQTEVVFDGAAIDTLTTDFVCVTKNRLGQSEGILSGSGYIGTNGKGAVKYRGVEDIYGHVFQGLLGVLKLGTHPPVYYYCEDPEKYAMAVGDGYREIGRCEIDTEGYAKTMLHNETAPFATSLIADQVAGASSTAYWCDYVYRNAKPEAEEANRLRVPFAGGLWNSGGYAGPWCVYWTYTPGGTFWTYGARLLVIPPWGARGA